MVKRLIVATGEYTDLYPMKLNKGSLLKISDPSKIAWTTNNAADLPVVDFEEFNNIDMVTGDIIVIDVDIGNGEKTYVVGATNKAEICFIDIAGNSMVTLASNLPTGPW